MGKYLPFVLLGLLLTSCMQYEAVEVRGMKSMRITHLSSDGIEAEVNLAIFNPNTFSFSITDYDLDIKMMNLNIGKARLDKKVKIEAGKEQVYPFRIKAKFGQMLLASIPVMVSMQSKSAMQVQTKGYVKVSHWGLSKKIPVDLDDSIELLK